MSDTGKKLVELRVCDLKDELEKRKLDTVGSKASLIERLEKVRLSYIAQKWSIYNSIFPKGFKEGGFGSSQTPFWWSY